MTGHVEQVYRLMAEADGLPDGPVKVTMVEQAAAVADSHRDAELAFQVRKTLLGVCLSADQSELMLVAFAGYTATTVSEVPAHLFAHLSLSAGVLAAVATFAYLRRR